MNCKLSDCSYLELMSGRRYLGLQCCVVDLVLACRAGATHLSSCSGDERQKCGLQIKGS